MWTFLAGRSRSQHPTDAELILALEQELSASESARVSKHLSQCWTCRQKLAELERGIHHFVLQRQDRLTLHPRDDETRRVRFLLRLAAEDRNRFRPQDSLGMLALTPSRAGLALASVLVVLVLLVHTSITPSVSAKELLRQSTEAETALSRNPLPLQEEAGLRIARQRGGRWSTALITESDPSRYSGQTQVATELRQWLRLAGISGDIRLSAAQFGEWATTVAASLTVDSAQRHGQECWVFTAQAVLGNGSLLQWQFIVRKSDKLAIEQKLMFERNGQSVLYSVTRDRLPHQPKSAGSDLAATASATSPDIADAKQTVPVVRTLPPAPWKIAETAIEVLAQLHREGLDLDGNLDLRIEPGQLELQGVVERVVQKERIEALLWNYPILRISLQTSESARAVAPSEDPTIIPPEPPVAEFEAFRKHAEESFARVLSPAATPDEAFREVHHFGRGSLDLSRELLQRAWAFQRLQQQFPATLTEKMTPAHAQLLYEITADHTQSMRQTLLQLRSRLQPVLPEYLPESPHGATTTDQLSVVEFAARIDRLCSMLFAGLAPDGSLLEVTGEIAFLMDTGTLHLTASTATYLEMLQSQASHTAQTNPALTRKALP